MSPAAWLDTEVLRSYLVLDELEAHLHFCPSKRVGAYAFSGDQGGARASERCD